MRRYLWNYGGGIKWSITNLPDISAYMVPKGFHFVGRRRRYGGFPHSAVMLHKNGTLHFERLFEDLSDDLDMEVHERVIVAGRIGKMKTPLIHGDYKGLESYISRHNKYSTWEARLRYKFLISGKYGLDTINLNLLGNSQERRRAIKVLTMKIPGEQYIWFIYHYFLCLGFLEGRSSLIASQIGTSYISQVRAKIFEIMLKKNNFNKSAVTDKI